MPGQQPNIVSVFRIVHIDNVEYLLKHGMFTRNHSMADPNYINIGVINEPPPTPVIPTIKPTTNPATINPTKSIDIILFFANLKKKRYNTILFIDF